MKFAPERKWRCGRKVQSENSISRSVQDCVGGRSAWPEEAEIGGYRGVGGISEQSQISLNFIHILKVSLSRREYFKV